MRGISEVQARGELTVFRFGHDDEATIDRRRSGCCRIADGRSAARADPIRRAAARHPVRRRPGEAGQDLGLLAQVGVDAAGIGAIVDALAKIGVTQDAETLDAVRQGIALMGAIKTIERKLADRSFRHGGQQLLSWCVGNLRIVPTPTAMRVGARRIRLRQGRSGDGAVQRGAS
jgi:hypothetical protein